MQNVFIANDYRSASILHCYRFINYSLSHRACLSVCWISCIHTWEWYTLVDSSFLSRSSVLVCSSSQTVERVYRSVDDFTVTFILSQSRTANQ